LKTSYTKAMKLLLVSLVSLLILFLIPWSAAQEPTQPAPTLVPPTLVPTIPADAVEVADHSGVATIQNENMLRVGALYNAPPFSFLDESGKVTGFEADVMNAIAVELGTTVEWVQVTGETQFDDLNFGRVDALIGEQIITRGSAEFLNYTHPYYLNQQRMVVLEGQPYQNLNELNSQPVSVVQGSAGEVAAQAAITGGMSWNLRPYFTEKEALDALANGEVQGMVGEYDDLSRAGRQGMRFITQPVQLDPYAIAIRRYDVNLRNALNRSLQRLHASGRLTEIYQQWFPDTELDFDVLLPVYENVFEDARTISQFPADIPIPTQSLVDRIQAGETLRVAGLSLNPDADLYERLLDPFNQAIMDEMARRWGASIEYIPNSALNAADLLGSGGADFAIGVTPRWDGADRFDYSRPYATHGEHVMVLEGSRFGSFGDFRGGSYMGFWYEDTKNRERIEQIAEALRVNTTVYEFRSIEEIVDQFAERNVDGIFGDTRRLRSIIQQTERSGLPWKVIDEPFSFSPITVALPRNDDSFRELVDWTLQDMFLDGTYQRLYNELNGDGEPLTMLTWPGDGDWLLGE
jgi:ABC-type amino acid transport substrate-binding protein